MTPKKSSAISTPRFKLLAQQTTSSSNALNGNEYKKRSSKIKEIVGEFFNG
jgi:hypothetical protein